MSTYKKYIFWLTLTNALFFYNCDKYSSKITGKVFYVDASDNINYPAAGAVITKITPNNDTIAAVIADINGEFIFEHQTKGSWILSGKFFKDTIAYFGISEEFSTNGIDQIEQNIILQEIINEESQ